MKKTNIPTSFRRLLFLLLTLSVVDVCAASYNNPVEGRQGDQVPTQTDKTIEVRIAIKKKTMLPGEPVRVHVEIWNEGAKDIFVPKIMGLDMGDNGNLEFILRYGTEVDGPRERAATDYQPRKVDDPNNPPLSEELSKYWTILPPGHFYGTEVILNSNSFKRLWIPGKYRIEGSYRSNGFLKPDEFGNPLAAYSAELKRLPYQAWEGKVRTNSVWIEVRAKVKTKQ